MSIKKNRFRLLIKYNIEWIMGKKNVSYLFGLDVDVMLFLLLRLVLTVLRDVVVAVEVGANCVE